MFEKGKPFWGAHNPVWNKGKELVNQDRLEAPTTREIAWAAGVYEGEGTIYTSRGRVSLQVAQKDKWLCQQLHRYFGGIVAPYINHTNSPSNPLERRTYWRWTLGTTRALGFAQTIYTFLSPRRQLQIRNVLDAVRS